MPPDPENYRSILALAAYIDRIGAQQKNFRRFIISCQDEDGYRKEQAAIYLDEDGTVTVKDKADDEQQLQPTEEEQAAIKAAFQGITFPRSVVATAAAAETKRRELGVDRDDWFVLLDLSRQNILMCQQRIEDEHGKKVYLPWTFFNDGQWRMMEPDAPLLPIWKSANKLHSALMIHEGAKSARYVDWLCNSDELGASAVRSQHPWTAELAFYDHWGWIGGAPNPHRTNWSEVRNANPSEVMIVADNDFRGQRAISRVSHALQALEVPVFAVMFDDDFPPKFDLADPFPKKMWVNDRYRGPHLVDCRRGATWATKIIPQDKRAPRCEIRPAFLQQWVCCIKPPVFVNKHDAGRLLNEEEFNAAVRPFSDVKNTADLIKREFVASVDSVAYEPGRSQGIIRAGAASTHGRRPGSTEPRETQCPG
jgi:hypothetical protein